MAGIEERRPRYSRFLQSLDARMRRTHIPEGGARLRRGVVLHTVSRGNIFYCHRYLLCLAHIGTYLPAFLFQENLNTLVLFMLVVST